MGVPYICNADGTWSNANSAGECTTACQDCRSGCNNNGTQDNGETGVDCGGGGCPACGVGAKFSCSSNGSCNPDANGTFTTPNCNNSCSCADCKQPADLVCKEFVSTDGGTTWSNPPSNNSVTASPGQRVNFKMEIHNSGNGIPWYGTRNNFDETINNYTNIWQNTDPNQADVFWLIYNRDPAFHGISWNNDYYNSGGEFSPGQTDVTAWSEVLTGNAQTFKNQGYAAVSTVVGGAIYRFPGGCTIANGVKQCCYIESESGGQSCHYFPDGCDTTFGQGCPYNATFQCNSVTVSTGTPTPTAVVNNTCTPVDTADLVTISWMNTFPAVSYVDISTDNFKSWYYKPVAGTASTNASSGFTGSQGPLTLGPGITYQVRLWNGVSHSSIVPFTTPAAACCQGNNIIDIPTDNTTYTTGNSYTIEGWSTFCSGPNSTNRNRVDPYICDQGTWNNCRYIGPTNPKVRQDVVNIATSPIWTCGNLNPNPDGWIFNWTPGSSFVGYKTLRVASINDAGNPPACVVWDTKNINIIAAPGAKYTCNGITCVPNANGAYSSLADCNANTACGSGGPNTPWIQTTGGDVHSNTGINTPGGP
ncbi:MAG: hypothetical protein Q7R82_00415 [Candidatus Daviesbacteria bacterium]|nr:hypothetical protein [Candidatus Daviesbacteria bacterium]